MEEAKMKIGSIVIRCYEFDRMLAFWQQALGYDETISTRIGGFRKECRGEGQGEEQEVGQGRQQA
jgi:hypothetical protein